MPNFGPGHRNHERVPWPTNLKQSKCTIDLPTSLIKLLANNDSPTDVGLVTFTSFEGDISQNILKNAQRKTEVTRQIQLLQQELLKLHTTHEHLEKKAFVCKVINSPFRRLPEDVIYHIVGHCAKSDITNQNLYTHLPSVLTKVSAVWRRCALSYSELWRDIRIDCKRWSKKEGAVRRQLDHFAELSASGGGLRITLTQDDGVRDSHFLSILKWIFWEWSHGDRVERLCLELLSPYVSMKQLSSCAPDRMKSLKELEILVIKDSHPQGVAWQTVTSMMSCMPDLQHLWLSDCHLGFANIATAQNTTLTLTPWSRLTTLHLTDVFNHKAEWEWVLRACSRLRAARFCVLVDDPAVGTVPLPMANPELIHNHLEHLYLQICGVPLYSPSPSSIFYRTSFPKLKTLDIRCEGSRAGTPDQLPQSQSPDCLLGAFPTLKELYIHQNYDDVQFSPKTCSGFFSLLLAVPTITTLSYSLTSHLLLELTAFLQENPTALPDLSRIDLHFSQDEYCWCDTESDVSAFNEALLGIRRGQLSKMWGTTRSSESTGVMDIESSERTSMNIYFDLPAWILGDLEEKDGLDVVKRGVRSLQNLCRQENVFIDIRLTLSGVGSNGGDNSHLGSATDSDLFTSGSEHDFEPDQFRALYFARTWQ
ncbi:hypothetical protein BJ165DRAFT_1491238 [Panaeolus papilionaceus]|nr:hypothetical protein BJ165DRAFT_1491238 [Panaeolus papilionaceus]